MYCCIFQFRKTQVAVSGYRYILRSSFSGDILVLYSDFNHLLDGVGSHQETKGRNGREAVPLVVIWSRDRSVWFVIFNQQYE